MEAALMKYMKYLLEGLAIAAAAYYLPQKNTKLTDVLYIGLVGALTFALLDMFAPSVGSGARLGSGFGIGANHVGFGEGFDNEHEPEMEGFYDHCHKEENFEDMPDMPRVDGDEQDGDEQDDDLQVSDDGQVSDDDEPVSNDDVPAVEDVDMSDQLSDMSDSLSNMSSDLANMSQELDDDKFTNYTKEPVGFNLY